MNIVYSPHCLEYDSPGHPESPDRVKTCHDFLLTKKDALSLEFIVPSPCSQNDILLVHSKELVDKVKEGNFFDPDTPNVPRIFEYASLAAGGAVRASEVASLEKQFAFSLMRPPGHHATRKSLGGFCYFNNIAIAITRAIGKAKKAAVLDLDVHHGNGTEDIFFEAPNVLFVSLHQSPLYPGTGLTSRKNCLNFPLPPATEETLYLSVLKEALSEIRNFTPGLIGISLGFDTYRDDPLANLNLEAASYSKISGLIRELNIPCFGVLEGGYSTGMAECLYNFLKGWQA
ncbi:MAG: histone deacetylase [Candidatus Omnitrophota bacterium]